ncbi:MAG: DNA mismatch endonuclease Vsr [Candidatus Jettenia sp.]|nr:DNA mismatch endonuclease Vsr [Candidatus Jettenia sp. AMX1]MBC6927387.1 DNA mismatch endonuclease Vsr [Candidatus Jettenia sp.]NUN22137.1 DNA mismatch endonuclease Vsr [Candidatus Jettenia caeni]KAA0251762.1 MAG: DNA mismatch endonuclease Vsr [Candidatus Jettenia sp. AMX1]MCE7879070.1 DNA mismatch endonuclease Vsr [Candidatus Jettenia sp. AMX1]MCQ3925816.1 DNA mismatch endonuclease Vsr [Candidatus Jettenia sp.]
MADVHNKATRSFNMSRIRSKDTKPEMMVRKFLFGKGYRYRLYDKKLPGKPDLVLSKYKTVIFVHGCFWHGHTGCKYFVVPKTKTEWWLNKINRNKELDRKSVKKLKTDGWKVIIIFECKLKDGKAGKTLENIANRIEANGNTNH